MEQYTTFETKERTDQSFGVSTRLKPELPRFSAIAAEKYSREMAIERQSKSLPIRGARKGIGEAEVHTAERHCCLVVPPRMDAVRCDAVCETGKQGHTGYTTCENAHCDTVKREHH